ncbi:AAA family ATPase [Pseudoalteromonas sp. ACER1]|jgi:energy-coupling factor transporter ATP-binding protein EcfA2|uniref:AAA family ATPase n=1 Tax=unclassified Pseudoalteromonas TaxID=194690 RepID=UPI001F27DACB|nr:MULTISPECIES: AAA family ATPase [unclassified Pseudoalteromonas]MCF2849180.1 AAA family ATPase [Pseudoalteromonas sp. PAST1]MCO7212654.1 AAA family ATPase [Pseudoalteromonas sp. ACER1]
MTAIEQISLWSEDKPMWWKHSIRLALRHGQLEQQHLNEIYHVARVEHNLEPPSPLSIEAMAPINFSGYMHETEAINLDEISSVKGVGLLAEGQKLRFSDSGLNIIYGDNGAGKSSYANILKNACLTRGDTPQIIGNIFEAHNPSPEANITVGINGHKQSFQWKPDFPANSYLKSVRVFDSSSAHHYVNKEDELGFKPVGLSLLTELSKAISQVKAIVNEDTMGGNGLIPLPPLNSDSPAALFIRNLSAQSDACDLEQHCALAHEDERIELLHKDIQIDKTQTTATKKATLNQQIELLNSLFRHSSNVLNYLGDKALTTLRQLRLDYAEKQQHADQLKMAILNDIPFETIAGISWQKIWNAAKSFLEQEPAARSFPLKHGDTCPLCLQGVTLSSEQKMKSLSEFLADNAATEATKAYTQMNSAISEISKQPLSLSNHKAALMELNKIRPNSAKRFEELFNQLTLRQQLCTSSSNDPLPTETIDISVQEELKSLIDSLTAERDAIKTDEDLQSLIRAKELELRNLEDRKFISNNREFILSNLKRLKVIEKMNALGQQCNTKPVSTLAAKISKEGLITPLVKAFDEELKLFGFIRFTVKASTRTKGANQQMKLVIKDGNEPLVSKIASEGEQRCIAIAAFLAEMKADHRNSAVIFDDPVNSLSHQWRSRVAERLVSESLERQVIVFTHDIVFYKLLLEAAESRGATHESCALERSRRDKAGLVRESAPWEALTTSKRIKALNAELRNIKKVDENGTEAEFRSATREFYGRLRESWERLVEEKLLNKVVSRFERGVQTVRLKQLTDITNEDILTVNRAMTKCSIFFTGHDSAPPVGDPYPIIEEIEADLQQLNQYMQELQNRKRT